MSGNTPVHEKIFKKLFKVSEYLKYLRFIKALVKATDTCLEVNL
jgi:hypothetical protein